MNPDMVNIPKFDPQAHEPQQSFDPLKPDWYAMTITESEVRTTRDGKSDYLQITLEISEDHHPEHRGRKVFEILNLWHATSEKAVEIAQRTLASICLAVQHDGELEDTEVLHHRLMAVKLGIEESAGYEPKNRVKAYDTYAARFERKAPPPKQQKAAGDVPAWKRNR